MPTRSPPHVFGFPDVALDAARWLTWSERTVRLAVATPDVDKLYGAIGRVEGRRWVSDVARVQDAAALAGVVAREAGLAAPGLDAYVRRTAMQGRPIHGVQVGRAWADDAPVGSLKLYHRRPFAAPPHNSLPIDRTIMQAIPHAAGFHPHRFEIWGVAWPSPDVVEVYAGDADMAMPVPVLRALEGLRMDMFSIHRDGWRTWYAHAQSGDEARWIAQLCSHCGVSVKPGVRERLAVLAGQGWVWRLAVIHETGVGAYQPSIHLARPSVQGAVFDV